MFLHVLNSMYVLLPHCCIEASTILSNLLKSSLKFFWLLSQDMKDIFSTPISQSEGSAFSIEFESIMHQPICSDFLLFTSYTLEEINDNSALLGSTLSTLYLCSSSMFFLALKQSSSPSQWRRILIRYLF